MFLNNFQIYLLFQAICSFSFDVPLRSNGLHSNDNISQTIQIKITMRDQPFNKNLMLDKSKLQGYRYPTYQHYYQNKPLRHQEALSPIKPSSSSQKNITDTDSDQYTPPPLHQKKSSKTSLKTQLENLKLEVKKIMERKQGILKSPVEKRLFPSLSEGELRMSPSPSKKKQESDDTQSITSENLIGQPIKQLQLKAATENYDHAKYMELQNELLKTELKNLKNKYLSKKGQLNSKCSALEKKVSFLETSLYNSQQALVAEIANLKASLKDMETDRDQEVVPTSDKSVLVQSSPRKSDKKPNEEEKLKKKIEELNEAIEKLNQNLDQKNSQLDYQKETIEEMTVKISQLNTVKLIKDKKEEIQSPKSPKKKQSDSHDKIQQLMYQVEQLKRANKNSVESLGEKQIHISDLEVRLEEMKEKHFEDNKKKMISWQQKLVKLKNSYEEKLSENQQEYNQLQQKMIILSEQNKLMSQNKDKSIQNQPSLQFIIDQLSEKIKEEQTNSHNIEQKYIKILESTQKKYQEKISHIHLEYQSIIINRKETKSIRDSASNFGEESPQREQQVRKWKLQYKNLKQKYELHVKSESHKTEETKRYHKNYRAYKDKVQVLTKKLDSIEGKSQKYLSSLAKCQKQLLSKEAQVRRLSSLEQQYQKKYEKDLNILKQKQKVLQEKFNDKQKELQKQSNYRKQMEEKVLNSETTDEGLKQTMERMKKRLIEHDEKQSKGVKDLKNKQALNSKLKQQLREVMENMEKTINEQKAKQIDQIVEKYIKKQFQAFSQWKNNSLIEKKILLQSKDKLISEIDGLKSQIDVKNEQIYSMRNQLNSFSHSYNLKSLEMNQQQQEVERMMTNHTDQLQELKVMKNSMENILKEQIMQKNDEVANLRMEMITQSMKNIEFRSFNSNFDNILKSHIEQNKKLREDITKKTEQIFKLRDNYGALRSQFQNIKAQIDINKLKSLSEVKNMQVSFQIQIQNIKNQLDMSQKKSNLLQQKLKLVIEENKKKDSFIQNYIVSKKLIQGDKDIVTKFMKQYEITIGSSDIVERLASQTKSIEQINNYNRILLREISMLKDKIVEYQAIDEEGVSIYNSKVSKFSVHSGDGLEQSGEIADFSTKKEVSRGILKKSQSMQVFSYQEIQNSE